MRIGELAERVGVNPKTIRFYEAEGLLPEPARRPSGYREYDETDVGRLVFIKTAQRLGLSLAEVGEILAFKERGERPCDYVIGVLDRQVADLDWRLAEMVALRADLVALQTRAEHLPPDGACYCSIIQHARPSRPSVARPG